MPAQLQQIRLRAITGTASYHDRGDISIDKFCVNSRSTSVINSFPYCESFEGGEGNWTNVGGDNFDWKRKSGTTPTSYTGPSGAADGSYYMFTEADKHLPSETALYTAHCDFSTIDDPELTFYYHMYGSEMGELFVDVSNSQGLFHVKGQQTHSANSPWVKATVDLSQFGGDTATIKFRAKTGNASYHDRGDIAIDQICIRSAASNIVTSYPYCESFESGFGEWKNIGADDFDWARRSGNTPTSYTGPSSADAGTYYLYIEADKHLPSDTAILEAYFDFSNETTPNISFSYHMYGSEMGELFLDVNNDKGVISLSGQQQSGSGQPYQHVNVNLSAYAGDTARIRFRAITKTATYHDRGDIAIDNISVLGPCNYWTGNNSSSWNDNNNWSTGRIPTCSRNIIIPDVSSTSGNFPVLTSGTQEVRDIEIETGAMITVQGNASLDVCGHWNNQGNSSIGSGKINFTGNTQQNIEGNTVFPEVEIVNSGDGLYLLNDLLINQSIEFKDGIVNTGANSVITLSPQANSIGTYSDSSFVNGNIRRYITAAPDNSSFAFPVGDGPNRNDFHPAVIINGNLTGTTYIDAAFKSLQESQ